MNREMMTTLVDKVIRVDRGGPESGLGRLLSVSDDHITVLTENDGVIYYQMSHIKSLTHNAKTELTLNAVLPEGFVMKQEKELNGLLKSLRYQWVRINRGGPEKLEGVLDEVFEDYVTLVANEEVIRLSLFHIRSISYGPKVEQQKEEKQENKEKQSDEGNKQENK